MLKAPEQVSVRAALLQSPFCAYSTSYATFRRDSWQHWFTNIFRAASIQKYKYYWRNVPITFCYLWSECLVGMWAGPLLTWWLMAVVVSPFTLSTDKGIVLPCPVTLNFLHITIKTFFPYNQCLRGRALSWRHCLYQRFPILVVEYSLCVLLSPTLR